MNSKFKFIRKMNMVINLRHKNKANLVKEFSG